MCQIRWLNDENCRRTMRPASATHLFVGFPVFKHKLAYKSCKCQWMPWPLDRLAKRLTSFVTEQANKTNRRPRNLGSRLLLAITHMHINYAQRLQHKTYAKCNNSLSSYNKNRSTAIIMFYDFLQTSKTRQVQRHQTVSVYLSIIRHFPTIWRTSSRNLNGMQGTVYTPVQNWNFGNGSYHSFE